ncbi:MAG: hypothetical protein PWP71_549 [Clostridia bacterium]|nr:hypothetical protein [Clostridia bacterium]
MNWAEFSIRNKYTIFALIIGIILFGFFSKTTLKEQLMPDTSPPLVNIITNYPGASAQEVAENVSEILEEEISLVSGVKKVKSTSQNDLSIVKVEFHYGVNEDQAALDVENAINRITYMLPSQAQRPQVLKFNTSDKPILTIALKSNDLSLEEIRFIADNKLKNELQLLANVAAVDVFGGHKEQINISLKNDVIKTYNLTPEKILNALKLNNFARSAGRITEGNKEFLIRIDEKFQNIEEIKNLIVFSHNNQTLYLKDIADIKKGECEQRSLFRVNGKQAISLQIIKKDSANTVDTVEQVLEKLDELKGKYENIDFIIVSNDAVFTNQVVSNMTSSILTAIILTALIILLFIVSLSESLIVALSMPLSFLSSLSLMKIFNLRLDLITLSALIVSIGFVVDNSIVVVESIMRHHKELGKSIKDAAVDGTREIILAVLAGTCTTIIVLIPLIFLEGFIGKVFGPLSKTLIFTLSSSLFVSLTIIPLLVSLDIKIAFISNIEKVLKRLIAPFNFVMGKILVFYISTLKKALTRKKTVLLVSLLSLVISGLALRTIGMELFPKLDTGALTISVEVQPGSNITETNQIVKSIESILEKEDEVVNYSAQIGYEAGGHFLGEMGALGVNQAYFTVEISSRKEREETIWQIQDRIINSINVIPGINSFVVKDVGSAAVATSQAPIDVRISGPDKELLNYLADDLVTEINSIPGVVNLYKGWEINTPELRIILDKHRLAELSLSSQMVTNQIFTNIQGINVGGVEQGGNVKSLAINVRYTERDRDTVEDLLDQVIVSPLGVKVPLSEIAEISYEKSSNIITRENLQYTIDIYGYTHDRAFSHVISDIEKFINQKQFPTGYSVAITGEQSELKTSLRDLAFSLILAIILVYLLLVAQFNSFLHPLTIMAAVPLVLIGVAGALLITNKYVSMPVILGLILLAGTVVNNSILLLDYILNERKKGNNGQEGILNSIKMRFRPIMMTALSDIAGMLPLALELALGSERFSPLAIAVIGGILTATFLTLIVVPVLYSMIEEVFYY